MTDALKVVPSSDDVSTGVQNTEAVATGLSDVLADTYCLVFKTHAYHWNVEGPLFYSVHNLTEEHYTNMFEAADALAERVRALGELAPSALRDIVSRSRVEDPKGPMSTAQMVEDLAADHERLAHRLHALAELAERNRDIVTEDMATARSAFHEQAAWMLRAISKS
ncbi:MULTISPECIES: Dps family protein [Roseobacteraceae]|uniref:Dps family protein n=1 Tax=Roseobacteraceae TaxID=2854170 RepID=UPI001C45BEBA|nr:MULTISPECIES: DNA starvation/stationary phase protection protein [Roseobacteraceae]MBV7409032.1 DNA starvation/stationary phase protection protein [Maritimibacter sp. DP1N21-5]MBY5934281.1 DNA starvation/stationary phase protection protein [Tateyamaria omphalii]